MYLKDLRRRIDALRSKMALELAVIELHRLAWDFAVKWGIALEKNEPVPEPHSFPRKVGATGVRVTSHMAATKYLEECRDKKVAPEAQKPRAGRPAVIWRLSGPQGTRRFRWLPRTGDRQLTLFLI